MVSPQCENGFTRIANELLEAILLKRIPGQELRIVLFVMRKTYGFMKKSDRISYGQIAKATGIPRTRVIMHIKSLVSKKVLGSLNNGTRQPSTIWINKDYSQWADNPIKDTSPKEETRVVPKKRLEPSPMIGVPQKKEEKETIQKKKPSVETSDEIQIPSIFYGFAVGLRNWIMIHKKIKVSERQIKTWENDFRLLAKMDLPGEQDEKEGRISDVLKWYIDNAPGEFIPVAESGSSFRDKFTRIELAIKKDTSNSNQWDKVRKKYGNQHNN